MKVKVHMKDAGIKQRLDQWEKIADKEQGAAVRAYGRTFLERAYLFTPPGNGSRSPGESMRQLRDRIRRDLYGDTPPAGTTGKLQWWRDATGELRAKYAGATEGHYRPGPFVVAASLSAKDKKALRGGVTYSNGQTIRLVKPRSALRDKSRFRWSTSAPVRLRWRGARDVVMASQLSAVLRTRMKRVGRMLAGWNRMAAVCDAPMPSAARRIRGRGSAYVRNKTSQHAVQVVGKNRTPYGKLQSIINRHKAPVMKAIRMKQKKRLISLRKRFKKR